MLSSIEIPSTLHIKVSIQEQLELKSSQGGVVQFSVLLTVCSVRWVLAITGVRPWSSLVKDLSFLPVANLSRIINVINMPEAQNHTLN